jgi:hypothetical protein
MNSKVQTNKVNLIDAAQSTVTNNFVNAARYVVPARRCIIARADNGGKLDLGICNISVIKSSVVQIIPEDEVRPMFRTPCQYLMIGAIKINYEAA